MPGFGFGFGYGLSRRRRGEGALSLLDQMNQYAADELVVSWLYFGDTTALLADDDDGTAGNVGHNGTIGLALGREAMAGSATAADFISGQPILNLTTSYSSSGGTEVINPAANTRHKISYTIAGATTGNHKAQWQGGAAVVGPLKTENGDFSVFLASVNNSTLALVAGGGFDGAFSNIVVQAVPGNHWSQPNAANRPLYYNSGGVTRLIYDGVGDDLVSVPHAGEHSYFICIDTSQSQGVLFHDIATSVSKAAAVWQSGVGSSCIGPDAGANTSVWVYEQATETWDEAVTRDNLHDAIVGQGPTVIEVRQFDPSGFNLIRTNNYTSFAWAGSHGDIHVVAEADRTDEMAVNISKYLLEQQGAV